MDEVADVLHTALSYDALKRLLVALSRRLEPEERQDRIEAKIRARVERNKARRERAAG
jgi:hypothetical protein